MTPHSRQVGRGTIGVGLVALAMVLSWPTLTTLYLLWYGTRP